jgi:hypothetical protein
MYWYIILCVLPICDTTDISVDYCQSSLLDLPMVPPPVEELTSNNPHPNKTPKGNSDVTAQIAHWSALFVGLWALGVGYPGPIQRVRGLFRNRNWRIYVRYMMLKNVCSEVICSDGNYK